MKTNDLGEWRNSLSPAELLKRAREDNRVDADENTGGIIIPDTTQIPNEILDEWLSELSGAELKVLLYLIRKTFGYSKENAGDKIPLSQIMNGTKLKNGGGYSDHGTGLSKPTTLSAIKVLENAGLIEVIREKIDKDTNEINWYRLITRTRYLKK